ncbi:ABC transporter substrate-binding protein [Jiangella asiatica]|uniref:Extracellular solute-binding protein n=1 Tax=Jiangella asiatica TaxID=2530372 RepID=A0A4R5DBR2_9ACTN|nr:extracellular solute-binding protein [Jiangella asiatica]TDE11142.1 extracellular solute-binding protein [Jiangella asiatica]
MRSSRTAARFTVLLAATALVTSCGGEDDGATSGDLAGESPEPGTTLSIWTFGATGLEEQMEAWAADRGVELEFKTGELDPHHEQLLTALVSGSVPDVAVIEIGYSATFKASPDSFVDLRDHGADELADDYLDWRWQNGVAADGTVIGLPTDVGGMALAYRTDLFQAAGLPTEPEQVAALWPSWDEFLAVAEQYTADTGQAFLDDSGVLFETVAKQGSEVFYDTDGEPIYDTNPQVERAWEVATAAARAGVTADLAAFSPEWNTGMAQGKYAVQLAPAWMLNYIQGQAPDTAGRWNVTTLPEGGGNWGGSQLAIPANAEHPDLAYDLITTVLSPESQLEVFQASGNFPSTPSLYGTPEMREFTSEFFSGAPLGQIYTASVEALEPVVEGEDQRLILREFGNGVDRVEKGDEEPGEAWASTLDAIALEID